MRLSPYRLPCGVLAFFLAGVASPSTQDQEISCQIVPTAVHVAFNKAFPKATITGCIKDTEGGRAAYEIASMEGETRRDVYFHADGTLIDIEEEVVVGSLSPSLLQVFYEMYPGSVIRTAEKITRDGAERYKLHGEHQDELVELVLHSDGTLLVAEETLAVGKLPKSLQRAVQ